jgi:hypothetical protein
VLNYGTTNAASPQTDHPLLSSPHFQKHWRKRTKIWPQVTTGPETKTDCAGEGQQ